MKYLFRITFLSGLLILCSVVRAQDWSPIYVGEKFNFKLGSDEIIKRTIWVDSVQVNGNDSIYFLNRIFKNLGSYSVIKNYPTFLQRELHFTPDLYIFRSPKTYVIPRFMDMGDSWIFDTTNNITATFSQIIVDSVLGQLDSIKIIELLGEGSFIPDTLKLSKSFGIIMFPSFENPGKNFTLVGLEIEDIGKTMPMIRDFFKREVGDIYQYSEYGIYTSTNGPDDYYHNIKKVKITDVLLTDSALYYTQKGLWKNYRNPDYYDPYYVYGFINNTESVVFNPENPLNYYNNEAITDFDGLNYYCVPVYYEMSDEYARPSKRTDKKLYYGSGDTLLYAFFTQQYYTTTFALELGEVMFEWTYWDEYFYESYNSSELDGYQINNIPHGNLLSFNSLMNPETLASMKLPFSDTTIAFEDVLIVSVPDHFDSYSWSTGADTNFIVIHASDYDPGTYQFSLETEYYYCVVNDTINVTIKYPDTEAYFTHEFESNTCTFTDQSSNPDYITSWHWDFGDGNTSDEQNPVHTFEEYGLFPVCLEITNMNNDTSTYCDNVGVYPETEAYFTHEFESNTCTFTDQSSNPDYITSWHWDFGDGNTSDEQNPVHTFEEYGLFPVCLEITNMDNDTSTYCDNVGVYPETEAYFTHEFELNTYTFTDQSSNPDYIASWHWDFGDGNTSDEQNPVHTFEEFGLFPVCLEIANLSNFASIYCDTVYRSSSISDPSISDYLILSFVYPDKLIIENTSGLQIDYTLRVVTEVGQYVMIVKQKRLAPNSINSHQLNNLTGGIYIVNLITDKGVVNRIIFR